MVVGGSPAPPPNSPSRWQPERVYLDPNGPAGNPKLTGELEETHNLTIWLILPFKNAQAASQPQVKGPPL